MSEYWEVVFGYNLIYLVSYILGFLYPIPLYKLYRGYRITKSMDYTILLVIYSLFYINGMWIPVMDYTRIEVRLWMVFVMIGAFIILDLLHAYRLKWEKPSKYLIGGTVASVLVLMVFGLQWAFDVTGVNLFWVLFEPFVIIIGIAWFYSYTTYEKVSNDRTSKQIVVLWQILAVLIFLRGLIRFLYLIGFSFLDPIHVDIAFYQNLYMTAMLLYIAVRYPEYLIISKAQIRRACNLYKLAKVYDEEKAFRGLGMIRLKEYAMSIPEDVFDCGD